jgi:nucleoside-diphosphate-sugar epimerase
MSTLNDFYKGRKVLITGGLGFLGSNLSCRLAELGADVSALDCRLPVHGANLFNISGVESRVKWVDGDIRDQKLVEKLIAENQVVFNFAAQTSHTDSMQNPHLDADINTHGQLNILEAARKLNPSIRLVYCSTRAIYGASSEKLVPEETFLNPMDVYAVHKLAGEYYHRIYVSVFGLNAVILRVANGYGPRAQMKAPSFGILNWFTRLAIDGQDIKIFGDGKQVRDYVYVDDISEAFVQMGARSDLKGEIFNVGSGQGVPLIDIVQKIVKIAGKGKIVHVPWPETNKKIDVGDFIADIRKLSGTGWKTTVALDEGLKKTVEFYEKNKQHYW